MASDGAAGGSVARLRRAERALSEAHPLLQRRRTDLGGPGHTEFEDRLLQGVRELAAAVRELAAHGGYDMPVSAEHAAALDAQADNPGRTGTWAGPARGIRARE